MDTKGRRGAALLFFVKRVHKKTNCVGRDIPAWHNPAVRALLAGPKCAAIMYRPKKYSDIAEPFSQLSARQQEVIALACDGLSNKQVARKLGVTEGTVKIHLHAIYQKLGVRSRAELMIAVAGRR
jgi:DNA-binding NarL/FixJ family response regulator